ncbi:hypothetical protein FisN_20Hu019 [Fistulifera solaris]|uniref:Uncharacterized protein n=1 Tax=Fistulifera solaris TaxID=1519565 RepID=A0A1Z5KC52_FISSO|nr:hypothetical protein FisN_20Hu019 [Fistulifera solaris]|eukprot:GAX23817.1 hypothetical protein FisN_20Hu019 [Fistulifera solaris]
MVVALFLRCRSAARCGLRIDVEDPQEEIGRVAIDSNIQEGSVPRYSGVKVEKEIDINEAILEGDDGFQAIAHLDTVEDLMEIVHNSYALLKEYVRRIKNVKPWALCIS